MFSIQRVVLQGSPLSALLFVIYLDPIFAITNSRLIAYADDVKLQNSNHSVLLSDLDTIYSWFISNDLHLNSSKTVCVFYSTRHISLRYIY